MDLNLLTTFHSFLPKPAQLLDVSRKSTSELTWFKERGHHTECVDPNKDLRLLTLRRESYDGIWSHQALEGLSIDDCQRVLASFFQALRPKTGILLISFLEGQYPDLALQSLLKQSGFQLMIRGEKTQPSENEKWIALFVRRV